jgi:hypothetical protein
MKFRLIAISITVLFILNTQAQEILFSLNLGFGQAETIRFKKNTQCYNTLVGFEKLVSHNLKMTTFLGASNTKLDYIDSINNQVHNQKTYISFIVIAKKIMPIGESKNYFWVGIGVSENLAIIDKKEIYSLSNKITQSINPKGNNISFLSEIGYNQMITPKASISLSLGSQNDFIEKYRSEVDKIRYDKFFFSITYQIKIKRN